MHVKSAIKKLSDSAGRRAHKSGQIVANGKGRGQEKAGHDRQLNVSLCREIFESFDWVSRLIIFALMNFGTSIAHKS